MNYYIDQDEVEFKRNTFFDAIKYIKDWKVKQGVSINEPMEEAIVTYKGEDKRDLLDSFDKENLELMCWKVRAKNVKIVLDDEVILEHEWDCYDDYKRKYDRKEIPLSE